jgi:hypothetical protein
LSKGHPDLLLVRPRDRRLIYVELKSSTGKLDADQRARRAPPGRRVPRLAPAGLAGHRGSVAMSAPALLACAKCGTPRTLADLLPIERIATRELRYVCRPHLSATCFTFGVGGVHVDRVVPRSELHA